MHSLLSPASPPSTSLNPSVTVNGSVTSTTDAVYVQATTGDVTTGATSNISGNLPSAAAVQLISNSGSVLHSGILNGVGGVIFQADQNVSTALGSTVGSSAGAVSLTATNGTSNVAGSITAFTTADVTSALTNTVSGSVSGTTTTITSQNADLQISGAITGTTAINLNSESDILNANILGGTFTTPQLNLDSDSGSIGASGVGQCTGVDCWNQRNQSAQRDIQCWY